MALKDWKQKYDNDWYEKKDNKGFVEQVIIDKQENKYRVGLYYFARLKDVLYTSKSKTRAIKFAKSYMRKN